MGNQGKRFRAASEAVDRDAVHSLGEAVGLIQGAPLPKFDESVDLAINLGVDPRHADQMVRGALVLPHGVGPGRRDVLDPLLAVDHEGQRPQGMALASSTVTGGFATSALRQRQ